MRRVNALLMGAKSINLLPSLPEHEVPDDFALRIDLLICLW